MMMFGQRGKERMMTDPKYWRQTCQVTNKDAMDAIKRAKTEQCRRELTSVACMDGALFPDLIPR